MTDPNASVRPRVGFARIAIYYALFAAVMATLIRYIPVVREAVAGGDLSAMRGTGVGQLLGQDAPPPIGFLATDSTWHNALVATVSMLGALAIMMPVTWVYMLTRRQRGYHESVVHTLLILPVAVTGIVMIVKSSVPLAFSLAGIVAAVRFRTTLEDTKDAVYVFLAIGVGLASGVQAVGVALALSLVFNVIVLVLWRSRFGNIYADPNASLGLGDVLAGPESRETALAVGDVAVLEAAAPADLAEIADRAVRIERHVSEERTKKKSKRANALLLVHAKGAQAAQVHVEQLLEELSARWKLAELTPTDGGVLLMYLARLDGPAVQGAVMDRMRSGVGEIIEAAELRSLKGLKPRA